MNIRPSFMTRIVLLFMVSLFAIQMLVVMAFYIQRGRNTDTGFRFPLPDQVAAMVTLIEATPQTQRKTVIRALNSAQLSVTINAAPVKLDPEQWKSGLFIERILKNYLKVLGGRDVTALIKTTDQSLRQKMKHLVAPNLTAIYITLNTGEQLAIEARGILILQFFGFSPGFWAGIFGFAIAVITILVIRREARPLRELAHAVNQLDISGRGKPVGEFKYSAPEIRAVITAFNQLQQRIASLVKNRMTLIGGISHDVRTYATRLRLRVEKIEDGFERKQAVQDLDDMIHLLDDALLAIEDKSVEKNEQLIDMVALLKNIYDDRVKAGENIHLDLDASLTEVPDQALILGNELALKRMIINIADNAIKYGDVAKISARIASQEIAITIDDEGPGIAPKDRAAIMEPFVRLEASRNRITGGAGLGLAIAKNVAQAHGGTLMISETVSASKKAQKSGRIILTLPLFAIEDA